LAILGLAEQIGRIGAVPATALSTYGFNNYDGRISTFTVKTGASAASRGRRGIGERL
jgi:hypothetical protein